MDGFWSLRGHRSELVAFCALGLFGNTLSLRRAELSKDEKSPCGRKLGRGYRSARSVVERTAGDTTGRERCEDHASV